MYQQQLTIRLHHTDAAGVLFFAHQLTIVHEVYESFLNSIGFPMRWLVDGTVHRLLIVHTEADYRKSLRVGDNLTVLLQVKAITKHSFTMHYDLKDAQDQVVGSAETVHVAVDPQTGQKTELSPKLRKSLQQHQ